VRPDLAMIDGASRTMIQRWLAASSEDGIAGARRTYGWMEAAGLAQFFSFIHFFTFLIFFNSDFFFLDLTCNGTSDGCR